MKNAILFVPLLLVSGICFGQKNSPYTLSINFAPSFIYSSSLIINSNGDSSSIEFKFNQNNRDKTNLKNSDLVPLSDFLKTYKYQIKNNIDTLGSYKKFIDGDSVTIYRISAGLDGIIVNGSLIQNDKTQTFAFWSPKKGTDNQKLISIIFGLLDKSFTNDTTISYLEQLKQYFPHNLGLKKLSNNPLKYKLYGSITEPDSLQLCEFFNSLPNDQKTFIDISNYTNMGIMFYPIIKDYCDRNQKIYWINPNYSALVALYKIGIRQQNIISKKRIIKIVKVDGVEKITSE